MTQTPSHMSSQVGPVVGSVLDTVTSSVVESVLVPSVDSVAVVGPAVESVVMSVAEPVVCPSVSLPDIVFPPVSVAVAGVELEPALVPGSVPSVSVSVPELVEVLSLSPQPAIVNSASATPVQPSNPVLSCVRTRPPRLS